MIWPIVVLLLGLGAFVIAWRLVSRVSVASLKGRLLDVESAINALHATRADADTVAALVDRVTHLEALQPEQEAQRRARRLG